MKGFMEITRDDGSLKNDLNLDAILYVEYDPKGAWVCFATGIGCRLSREEAQSVHERLEGVPTHIGAIKHNKNKYARTLHDVLSRPGIDSDTKREIRELLHHLDQL